MGVHRGVYARHIGRVGALAVALGVGVAVAASPGVAWADDPGGSDSNTGSANTPSGNSDARTTSDGADSDANDTSNQLGGTTDKTTTRTESQTTTGVTGVAASPTGTSDGSGGLDADADADDSKTILESTTPAAALPTATPPPTASYVEPTPTAAAPAPAVPVIATPTTTVDLTQVPLAPTSSVDTGAPLNAFTLSSGSEMNAILGEPLGRDTDLLSTARSFAAVDNVDGLGTSNLEQVNSVDALLAPALPIPSVPPPSLVDTVLAIPGTFISTALNLITQALAPLIGPGAPADNPILWGVLAFVRRQFNQGFANSTPVLAPQQTSQDAGGVYGTLGGADADGDTLAYAVPSAGLGAPAHGTVTINQATGTYTYTPNAGYVGDDYFFVTATDETAGSHTHALGQSHVAAARVDVTVAGTAPINVAPVATNGTASVTEDTPYAGTLPTGSDANGDALTYVLGTSLPAHGTITDFNAATGSYTYTPAANYSGTDSFTYTVSDATLSGNVAAVAITVTAVNDAPVTVSPPPISTIGGVVYRGTLNATDVDSTTLTFAGPVVSAAGGTVAIETRGSFTYISKAGYQGPDSFTYTVTDGTATAAGTVSVAVNPASIAGFALGNAVVGSTGLIYQPIVLGTSAADFTTFVRVYQSNGALIGDSAAFAGVPTSVPVIRTDGSLAVTTFDISARTAIVRIIGGSQSQVSTTTTTFQADGNGSGIGGQGDRRYLITAFTDAQNQVRGRIVPLSAGDLVAYDASTVPAFGPDGSAAAFQITGNTPQTLSVKLLIIDADGTARTEAASEFLTSGLAGGLSIGPDGTVYLPTVVSGQSGEATAEILSFNPGGGYTKSQIPDVTPRSNVVAASDGTAYVIVGAQGTGNTTNYQIAVLSGGGAITSPTFSTSFFGPEIIGTSEDGTFYVLDPDSDNDVSRVIVARPNGTITAVNVGEFSFSLDHVIGADNNLYVNYREGRVRLTAVITPSGQKRVLPFAVDIDPFTLEANNLAFADDGTAFAAVPTQGGVKVLVSRNGFASFDESVPITGNVEALAVGPDGTAVLVTRGSGVIATSIDSNGDILATFSSAGEVAGPVAFDENTGSAYVVVVQTDPSTGGASTSVWGITLAGATTLTTVAGSPAGGQNGTGASLSVSQQGDVLLTTTDTDANGTTFTNVTAAPGASLPPAPYQVSRNKTDYTTGASTVTVSVRTASGVVGDVVFTGSTQSPIGDVVVDQDGTVTFTPNAAGRQLAAQSDRIQYASFLVTAIDSQGRRTVIPVSAPLLPTGFPTNPEPLPIKYQPLAYIGDGTGRIGLLGLPGAVGDNVNAGARAYSVGSLVDVTNVIKTTDSKGRIISTQETWTRDSSVDPEYWKIDPLSGLPVNPDVYVVSLLRPGGRDGDTYVLGYRKLNFGESVTVTRGSPQDGTTPFVTYDVAVFEPGTFPKQLFKTRVDPAFPDAELGGVIFNNQIAEEAWTPWQQMEDEFEQQYNLKEEQRLRAPYIGQGASATLSFLELSRGTRAPAGGALAAGTNAKRIVKGIQVSATGVIQVIDDEDEIIAANGDDTTPVFLENGVVRTTRPPVGDGGGA